jgi:glycosyltransferase involved in cell wall biosynthesis
MWFWVSKHAPQILFEFFEIGYNVFIYVKISLILKDQKIDLILKETPFFLFSTALISKKTKVPMILEVNEIVGIKRQRNQIMVPLARLLEQYVFKRASSIIVVSDFLKSELVKRGVEGKNILVLPNAVNPDDFNVEITGEEIRSKYLLSDKVVLVFMGTFSKWDNFDFLLGNFKELVLEYPNVCLLIIGDGQDAALLNHLKEQIALIKVCLWLVVCLEIP